MPLPMSDTKSQWPPASLDRILSTMVRWDAWWSNDLEKLQAAYGGGFSGDPAAETFFQSDTGRFRAAMNRTLHRWFVGEPARGNERNTKVPVPIASEMCQASADLLFSDPFTVTVDDTGRTEKERTAPDGTVTLQAPTTQDRINDLLDEEFHSTYAEAAEMCAALGGVYLLVSWDPDLLDHPFPTIKNADQAIPEFRFGRLTAVTFWSVVKVDGKTVWRHVERHETTGPGGNGVIRHGLYEGTTDTLGTRVSLTMVDSVAGLAANVDLGDEGTIDTGTPGLAVEYIPNQTPNRAWRNDPIGRNLGRADIDGVEHLIDQLAETMSDWMRARRVARARIAMSKSLAKTGGTGEGAIVNLQQETYLLLDRLGTDQKLADMVQVLQPDFEPAGYQATAEALLEQILQMAGYSMQTFGVGDTGTVRTATEINSKERRSFMTRSRKLREWTPALIRHLTKLLLVDNHLFGQSNKPEGLAIEFSDGVQETELSLAQTVLALYQAESASLNERVSTLHPDWSTEDIDGEVALIQAEFAHPAPADPVMNPFEQENELETADGGNPTAD